MYHTRGNRGGRRRGMQAVIQSYKKIINFVPASYGAGFNSQFMATGQDSVAAGQTGVTDVNVPTGSIIKFLEIQFAVSNIVSGPTYVNCTIQYILSGQGVVNPDSVGGNPQRNQVLHQEFFAVGKDQNSLHKFKFKIPPKFRRLREGMSWVMVWSNNVSVNNKTQIIYKFYR